VAKFKNMQQNQQNIGFKDPPISDRLIT